MPEPLFNSPFPRKLAFMWMGVCVALMLSSGCGKKPAPKTVVVITAALPGASAETTASSIGVPLEKKLALLPGVEKIQTRSSAGTVTLWVQLNGNPDADVQNVTKAVQDAQPWLPKDLPAPPSVQRAGGAVFLIGLKSEVCSRRQLWDMADRLLAQKLARLPGIAAVRILGPRPEIRITFHPEKLAAYGLSVAEVRESLQPANDVRGSLDDPRRPSLLRTTDQPTATDLSDRPVAMRSGQQVLLKDLAEVQETMSPTPRVVPDDRGQALNRDLLVAITAQSDVEPAKIADSIKTVLPQLQASLPQGVNIAYPVPAEPPLPHTALMELDEDLPADMTSVRSELAGVGGFYKPAPRGDLLVRVFASNPADLAKTADLLSQSLQRVPGVTRTESWPSMLKPTIHMELDRDRAAELGVSMAQVQDQLALLLGGQTLSNVGAGLRQERVVLTLPPQPLSPDDLSKMFIKATDGKLVSLNAILKLRMTADPEQVYTINHERAALVFIYLNGRNRSDALADVKRVTTALARPAGTRVEIAE